MDIGSVSSLISIVRDMVNQATLLKNLTSDIDNADKIREAQQKSIELTNTIIDLQSAVLSMQTEYMQLIDENHRLKKAQADQNNYELIKYPTKNNSELLLYKFTGQGIPHYLCPNCWGYGNKSILQQYNRPIAKLKFDGFFKCSRCDRTYNY